MRVPKGYDLDNGGGRLPREGFPRWVRWLFGWLPALAAALLVAGSPALALADAGTIPERQADAREVLGYGPSEPFVMQPGKWGIGELEIGVDSKVGLPNVWSGPGFSGTQATYVRLTVHGGSGIPASGRGIFSTSPVVAPKDPTWVAPVDPYLP